MAGPGGRSGVSTAAVAPAPVSVAPSAQPHGDQVAPLAGPPVLPIVSAAAPSARHGPAALHPQVATPPVPVMRFEVDLSRVDALLDRLSRFRTA